MKKQQVLQADLQKYVEKWDNFEEFKQISSTEQSEQSKKFDVLRQDSYKNYTQVRTKQTEIETKEKRLEDERQSLQLEMNAANFKNQSDLSKLHK